jgi:DNA-binding transcriptional LysR family regulator
MYVKHCGSFSKGAEALYLSQPSITDWIRTVNVPSDEPVLK